jgi:hypothetical protein
MKWKDVEGSGRGLMLPLYLPLQTEDTKNVSQASEIFEWRIEFGPPNYKMNK